MTTCALDFTFFIEELIGLVGGKELKLTEFHKEWIEAIQTHDRVAILAPTGFGKTNLLGVCYPIWRALFNNNERFLIVSNAQHQSVKILSEIKEIIENNEILLALKPEDPDKWSQTEIQTTNSCRFFCKPYNVNIKGYHVDYILCDEADSYRDPELFFDYVVPRAEARRGKVCCISTPESIAALMSRLKTNKEYWYKEYPAIINYTGDMWSGTSIYPERYTIERLKTIHSSLGHNKFMKNYMVDSTAPAENALFPPGLILNSCDDKLAFNNTKGKDEMVFLACDFAITSGPDADFDAYTVVSKHKDGNITIKHGEIHKGFSTSLKIKRIIEICKEFPIIRIIIDPSSVGAAVIEELRAQFYPADACEVHSAARSRMLVDLRNLMGDPEADPPIQSKLIIPRSPEDSRTIAYTDRLIKELVAFAEIRPLGGVSTVYRSRAKHDDTVMSLAMACKVALASNKYDSSLWATG